MKLYTVDEPTFSESMPLLEISDTNHADNLNASAKMLLANTVANRRKMNKQIEQGTWDPIIYSETSATGEITNQFNIRVARYVRILNICFIEMLVNQKDYISGGINVGSFSLPYKLSHRSIASYQYGMSDGINVAHGDDGYYPVSGYARNDKEVYQFYSEINLENPGDPIVARGYYFIEEDE